MAIDQPQRSTRPVPRETLERLCRLLELGYEAAIDLTDRGEADWSLLGEPIGLALRIVRQLRFDRRDLS